MYTEIEATEMARHFMWRRIFNGKSPTKAEKKLYCRHSGEKPMDYEAIDIDYSKAEEYLIDMHEKRKFNPAYTPSPYDMEEEEMIGTRSDVMILDDIYEAKEALMKANIPNICYDYVENEPIRFADCKPQQYAPAPKPMKAQKKENNMSTANINVTATTAVDTAERGQREHLNGRLYTVREEKRQELRGKFFMGSVELKTLDEVNAALKNGTIVMDKDYANDRGQLGWFNTSMLRVVNTKRDEEGYKAADKLLGKAYTDAKDKIIVLPVEKGLVALNDFEAATF